ncbi:MAG TPA: 50S ribosomal protein L19 [Saprospiraceae bacterium]|nr:50S ribosomal protein L19 [Saprospiraceae bacterium]HQW54847.1 50S ribosomal protein L19 [Saprospiraceae bacterium]
MDAIKFVNEQTLQNTNQTVYGPGDHVEVSFKIIEGAKERVQIFKGDVIQIKGHGLTKSFTVRKISNGVGVERIFPVCSPSIVDIKVIKRGRVRRARLYYLRALVGKAARIREKNRYTTAKPKPASKAK